MTPEEKVLGQSIFLRAVEMNQSKRNAIIQDECNGNSELIEYVLNLLSSLDSSDEYFDDLQNVLYDSYISTKDNIPLSDFSLINIFISSLIPNLLKVILFF